LDTGLDGLRARLQAAGLRVTAQRLAILNQVQRPGHHSAAELRRAAQELDRSVSAQAVYDNLSTLEGAGLVRRLSAGSGPSRYEDGTRESHHHLVCGSCAKTLDVACEAGLDPCSSLTLIAGYAIDDTQVTHLGTCPECLTSGPPSQSQERWR